MTQNLVNINFYGVLKEHLGRQTFKYAAKTIGQCINAVEVLSGRKLYKFLLENDQKGIKYQVLINGKEFVSEKPLDINNIETIQNSELCMKHNNLKTIDIVPVLEGSAQTGKSIGAIVVGVILITIGILGAVGTLGIAAPLSALLIIAGIGLIAAGIINLLMQPPNLQDFVQKQKTSYLFSGPTNTISEGQPVPVGYGTLLIGSVPVSASYDIEEFDTGYKSTDNVNKKPKNQKHQHNN